MTGRGRAALTLVALLALLGGACGDDQGEPTTTAASTTTTTATTTSAAPTTTTTSPTTTTATPVSQICQVAGIGGIDDGSVNQLVWEGLGRARDQLGVEVLFLASDEAGYGASIDTFIGEGCDLIVTVGPSMEADTAAAACDYPEQLFAIVGASPVAGVGSTWADAAGELRCSFSNVRGITFATQEAAFLAGYLAAGMSESGKVGTFGSTDLPTVTSLMDAFTAGARYFGEVAGPSVQVIGWNPDDTEAALFTGADDPEQAGLIVESLAGLGVDVILSAAGAYGRSGATVAAEEGMLVIGGVGDSYLAEDEFAGVSLTSLEERADAAVLDTVIGVIERGDLGGPFVGTLANRGVGLAAYLEPERAVPVELADAVDQLAADIAAAGGLAAFLAPDEG